MSWVTAIIAALVLVVAYFQWRTAHQRVVLDLFERRLRVLEDIEQAIQAVVASTQVTTEEFRLLNQARTRARFLFGDDVNRYLKELNNDFAWRLSFTDEVINNSANRAELITREQEFMVRIVEAGKNTPELFAPYIRLTQKLPSPWLPF